MLSAIHRLYHVVNTLADLVSISELCHWHTYTKSAAILYNEMKLRVTFFKYEKYVIINV